MFCEIELHAGSPVSLELGGCWMSHIMHCSNLACVLEST